MTAELAAFNIHDAKTNLSRIIDRVEHGEEIIISRAGHPVAKVVPLEARARRTGRGSLAGRLHLAEDWDSPEVNEAIARDFGLIDPVSLLLDTHVVLWWLEDAPALPLELRRRIDDDPAVYLSVVTVWEIAIKQAVGKVAGPDDVLEIIQDAGFRSLSITAEHAVAAGRLPLLHRDPFDRMLIAQAGCAGLTLVTHDRQIQRYDVDLLPL